MKMLRIFKGARNLAQQQSALPNKHKSLNSIPSPLKTKQNKNIQSAKYSCCLISGKFPEEILPPDLSLYSKQRPGVACNRSYIKVNEFFGKWLIRFDRDKKYSKINVRN